MSKSKEGKRKSQLNPYDRVSKSIEALHWEMLSRAKDTAAAYGLLDRIREVKSSLQRGHHWKFAVDLWTATRPLRASRAAEYTDEAIKDELQSVKPWKKRRLRQLSKQAGGWWDFYDSGWPMQTKVPVFVLTVEWEKIYAEDVRSIRQRNYQQPSQPGPPIAA